MKINTISLSGFRGATNPTEIEFDTTKPVILIFGENGTGKSTITDAIDFVCNNNYGSLGESGIASKAKNHIFSHGKKPSDLKVKIKTTNGDWESKLTSSGPITTPDTGYPEARILRRKSITRLIDAVPSKRYDEIRAFIEVPYYEKSEENLRRALKTINEEYESATRALSQAQIALENLWETEGKPGANYLKWAQTESKKDVISLQNNINAYKDYLKKLSDAESAQNELDDAKENLKIARSNHRKAEQDKSEVENKLIKQNENLLKILQAAKKYIEKNQDVTECPVCTKTIKSSKLIVDLNERISEMNELDVVVTKKIDTEKEVERTSHFVIESTKKLITKTQLLIDVMPTISQLIGKKNNIGAVNFDEYKTNDKYKDEAIKTANLVIENLKQLSDLVNKLKEDDQKTITLQNALKNHYSIIDSKREIANNKEKIKKIIELTLPIIESERKNYVEEILAGISSEIERLYSSLHPGEDIGKIRFYLKESAKGSLEFDASFHGNLDLPPQAYYSESHLDTLGICIFIALSKYYKTDNTIIILDDVLTSVDADHMDRFMKLLHDESKNFNQVFVTTHYRPWRDRYRWSRGPSSNIGIIELGPWNIATGIITNQFQYAIDELKKIASQKTFDRQHAASLAGVVLESLLDFITIQYSCSLPRNPKNEYTLGDLVNGIDSKFARLLKIKNMNGDIELKPLLDKTISEQWIRNCVGCHFNTLGSEITDDDVKTFVDDVIKITDLIICTSCRTFPRKNKSGSYLECNCGNHQMHPLTQPGMVYRNLDNDN